MKNILMSIMICSSLLCLGQTSERLRVQRIAADLEGNLVIKEEIPSISLFDQAQNRYEFTIYEYTDNIIFDGMIGDLIIRNDRIRLKSQNGPSGLNPLSLITLEGNRPQGIIEAYNANGIRTFKIDGHRINTDSNAGSIVQLFDQDGSKTIDIESDEGNNGNGGQITMYDRNGDTTVELDGDFGNYGKLDLYNRGVIEVSENSMNSMIILHGQGTSLESGDWRFGIGLFANEDGDCPGQCELSDRSLGFSANGSVVRSIDDEGNSHKISDERLKYSISGLTSIIPKLLEITPKSYKWKHNGKSDIGLIAQNILEVFPEAVKRTNSSEGEILMVNYEYFIPILTKAIQEQQEIINQERSERTELNQKYEAMEEKINALLSRIEQLEN